MRDGYGFDKESRSPIDAIEEMDIRVELAALDEEKTMFDPDTHPRAHRAEDPDEPVADRNGEVCDIVGDTPAIDLMTTEPTAAEEDFDLMGDTPAIETDLDLE